MAQKTNWSKYTDCPVCDAKRGEPCHAADWGNHLLRPHRGRQADGPSLSDFSEEERIRCVFALILREQGVNSWAKLASFLGWKSPEEARNVVRRFAYREILSGGLEVAP